MSAAKGDLKDLYFHEQDAEAYNTFVLVGTLIFGFGITVWFEFDETLFDGHSILFPLFSFGLSLVIILSGFGSVVMAIEHYSLRKLLAVKGRENLETFYQSTKKWKLYARTSIYGAFAALYFSLACYGLLKLEGSTVSIVLCISSFVLAFLGVIFATYRVKTLSFFLRRKDREKNEQSVNLAAETI